MDQNFLHLTDLNREELDELLSLAAKLKIETKAGANHTIMNGKTLAMIFQKPSARTRISFEVGTFQLGGHALYLSPSDIGLGKREAVKDIARVLSRYNDIIMARVFHHSHILELAEYATVPVINGLSDYNHPCQVLADIFTILEHRGHLKDLKVAFIGDGNNVAHSWMNLAQILPMELVIICPKGFEPDQVTFDAAHSTGKSNVTISYDPNTSIRGSDVIYTDVWASMGQEEEAEDRKREFLPYQVNAELMKSAGEKAFFMHCLPAHRGDEVTDEVIDGSQSIVFDEAENRLHIQKAVMVTLLSQK